MSKTCTAAAAAVALALAAGAAAAARPEKKADRPWGAVAYSTVTGVYGYAVNHPSRRSAESEAFRHCGPDCDVIRSFRDACGALAVKGRLIGWDTGSSRAIAEMKAKRQCGSADCEVAVWACTRMR